MKRNFFILFLLLPLFFTNSLKATVHTVEVLSLTFVPADLEVMVGDTVMWILVAGIHTTTSGEIPSGATAWNQQIDQSTPAFSYEVTVPGEYNYVCLFHEAQGMVAKFTATSTTQTSEPKQKLFFEVAGNPIHGQINVNLHLPEMTHASFVLLDVAGRPVKDFGAFRFKPGNNTTALPVIDIEKGMYFLNFKTRDGNRLIKKVWIN